MASRCRSASSTTPQALELMTAVGPPDWASTALPECMLMAVHLTTDAEFLPIVNGKNRSRQWRGYGERTRHPSALTKWASSGTIIHNPTAACLFLSVLFTGMLAMRRPSVAFSVFLLAVASSKAFDPVKIDLQ